MTPSQQAKEYAKRHGLKIDNKNGVVTISKRIVADSWFIECFDNYKQVVDYFTTAHNKYVDNGINSPWSTYNVK